MNLTYNLLILLGCLLGGVVAGLGAKYLGFTGIKSFFNSSFMISCSMVSGGVFFCVLLIWTGFFFPLAIAFLIYGFLKGLTLQADKFGENMDSVDQYQIVSINDDNDSNLPEEDHVSQNKEFSNKRKKLVEDEVQWPDIKDL
jgi:hypothetical protein